MSSLRSEPLPVPGATPIAARLLDLLVETTALEALLAGICELAVELVPGCTSSSIMFLGGNMPATVAWSDLRALAVDEAQYRAGDGPGLRAVRTDVEVTAGLNSADGLDSADSADGSDAGTGLTSVVAMPLPCGADVHAALNLYFAGAPVRAEALEVGDELATYAGDAIIIGRRLAGAPSPAPGE